MKHFICPIASVLLLLLSHFVGNAQNDRILPREAILVHERANPPASASMDHYLERKIMLHRKDRIWVLGQNNARGHWARPRPNEIKLFKERQGFVHYGVEFKHLNSYETNRRKSTSGSGFAGIPSLSAMIPKKIFNIGTIQEDWSRIHEDKRARNLNGKKGKTNVYYFKNIGKNELTTFSSVNDHIIVTDTLYGPASFLNTDGRPRSERRSYIKIIANSIVYESPIRPASTRRQKTDYVFSAKNILFKSPYKGLLNNELHPSPPFVVADTNIKVHKDFFGDNEGILVNRLYIEIMEQLVTELRVRQNWEKDRSLGEFQKYRHKVDTDILALDREYREVFNRICSEFDLDYSDYTLENDRVVDGHIILMEGNLSQLPETPFKYYSLPTNSSLVPTLNRNSGEPDMLGSIFYEATGDAKLSMAVVTKLGYDTNKFNTIDNKLKKEGFGLEKWPPNTLVQIEEQPLKINGKTIGRIIPVNNQILRLEINIPDNSMAISELFPINSPSVYDIVYDVHSGKEKFRQAIPLEVPKNLLDRMRPDRVTDMFNVVESNTLTDIIKLTSHLLPVSEDLGVLNHIEISLEFLFDNEQKVFRGPFNLSSNSTLASELEIPFIKYSENYEIRVLGRAYYEFGEREIKKDFITNSKFIQLEEGILSMDGEE